MKKEYKNQILVHESGSVFSVNLSLGNINLNKLYAVFVKPDKYLGKLFCSKEKVSRDCRMPEFMFTPGENTLDLTRAPILPGDIKEQDGKIDAYDIAKIINDLGRFSDDYIEADVNSDGIVNAKDYNQVVYVLSQNAVDDYITIAFDTPQEEKLALLTNTPASFQLNTTSTPVPTSSFTSTSTPVPTFSSGATSTPAPFPTATSTPPPPASTPTPETQSGKCIAVASGEVYVNIPILGSMCRRVDNEEGYGCVDNASECTASGCEEGALTEAKKALAQCFSLASVDEQKTHIDCQVQFVPGDCVPMPIPTVSCDPKDSEDLAC